MYSLKLRSKEEGYILLLLMLVIGSIGLYLTYQFSLQKIGTQSWQLAKTATEFSYWMDIEQNYELDYASTLAGASVLDTAANYNNIKLLDLISNKHYFPYGMARSPTFKNNDSDQVSEFLCSPLPGINAQTTLTWNGDNQSCPISSWDDVNIATHCELAPTDKIYYSCANNAATNQAQYYVNANFISIGNNQTQRVGLGLIIPTPGFAASQVDLATGTGVRAILPNGSAAQALMSILPGAAFNVYTTQIPQVNAIGVASYLSSQLGQPLQQNNRYSKIIDMGLVQAVDLEIVKKNATTTTPTPCYGWDTNGNKTGIGSSYDGVATPSTGNSFPPTCIRINAAQYPYCKQIDVLYTLYRNFIDSIPGSVPSQFYSYTDSYIQTDASNPNIRNIFLSQSLQKMSSTGSTATVAKPAAGQYTSNGGAKTTNGDGNIRNANQRDTWLAYIVRCTQDNV